MLAGLLLNLVEDGGGYKRRPQFKSKRYVRGLDAIGKALGRPEPVDQGAAFEPLPEPPPPIDLKTLVRPVRSVVYLKPRSGPKPIDDDEALAILMLLT